ncbi:alpha/beta hydrolase [Actinosynnema sp. NPDC047251]|uniref:Alpha/beta hydrolase fold containing protein n=1 Tax=Saccharothrix espanaensis (strain ATCC 51144 / DSM 44229 / JCM 9112 / NBRC 15066 / NRRL 15764) TaxID=1179773 RepID=K0K1D1_SACES|nr:alpha/beta hydrolase [Saccharothrix espanaensis]CCH30659.1 alpha/beta hydrolase fold containing protein [Saccharothrix espanaensis DSM 44229]
MDSDSTDDTAEKSPEDAVTASRPSSGRLLLRRLLMVLGSIVAGICAWLALGTFVPGLPIIGTIGSLLLPPLAGPFIVVGLVGAALAFTAARLGVRRTGLTIALVGVLSSVGSAVVLIDHVVVGQANGADIRWWQTFLVRGPGVGESPPEQVAYASNGDQTLKMEVYRPKGTTTGAPVLVYVHGGAFAFGIPSMQSANLRWFADNGFLVFGVEYTLGSPQDPNWDTAGPQVACALRWLAENAAGYGGDADRSFAYGESAGGALVLNTAYAAAQGKATSWCGGTVPKLRAVAAEYPAVDPVGIYANPDLVIGPIVRSLSDRYLGGSPDAHPDRARAVSSITYVGPNAPPTLLFVADADHVVPVEGTLRFADAAKKAGVDIRTIRYRWADHTINHQFYSAPNQTMRQLMLRHFRDHGR